MPQAQGVNKDFERFECNSTVKLCTHLYYFREMLFKDQLCLIEKANSIDDIWKGSEEPSVWLEHTNKTTVQTAREFFVHLQTFMCRYQVSISR